MKSKTICKKKIFLSLASMTGIILSNGLIKSPFALSCLYIKGSKAEINDPFLFFHQSKKDSKDQESIQVPHLSQDNKLESNKITLNITNKIKRSALSLQVTIRQQ